MTLTPQQLSEAVIRSLDAAEFWELPFVQDTIRQLWDEREANRADIERLGEALHKADLEMQGYAVTLAKHRAVMQRARGALDELVRNVDGGQGAIFPDTHPINKAWSALTALTAVLDGEGK